MFLVPLIGAALIALPKIPYVGSVLVALSGVALAGGSAAFMSSDASTVFAYDGTGLEAELDQAAVSTGAGLYLALLVGLLLIAAATYELIREIRAAAPSPVPIQPQQPPMPYLGQAPHHPHYGPVQQQGWQQQPNPPHARGDSH